MMPVQLVGRRGISLTISEEPVDETAWRRG
jgi:hypothetical protein